jgi:hypothetical protein
MERTVPSTASEEVELYSRTYYSLLRSTAEVQIRTLEEAHAGMKSLMHPAAREESPDMSAFIYSILRLPRCICQVQRVVLGQSLDVFVRGGYEEVETWEEVSAFARRRKCYFDGKDTLACFIASRSDIDDVIPQLTAFQIEWNKIHRLLQRLPASFSLSEDNEEVRLDQMLADILGIAWEDVQRLRAVWEDDFVARLELIAAVPCRLKVQLLSGSYSEYRRATRTWWENIERRCPALKTSPIYFVSSNTHSFANVLTGFALQRRDELLDFLDRSDQTRLRNEWRAIQAGKANSAPENFFFYVLKKYQSTPEGSPLIAAQLAQEEAVGIRRVPSERSFDVEAQVIDLSRLRPEGCDPRLNGADFTYLNRSDAFILNVDYPLGLAAYNILSEVSESVGKVLGVYAMGKAATLNATIGDVMIPNVVHDEHSQNTYLFPNCFASAHVAPFLRYGTVLDNQKAVSVLGTFLQTAGYMDVFYREGYTDIEMESGPYLSAVYEMFRPRRHPVNEIVNYYGVPFDLGVIHYASDTPLSKGRNLGAGNLSYYGMDSTYAATLAILRRIFELERERVQRPESPYWPGQRRPLG